MLTIAQAANQLGVSIDTLRRWEAKGGSYVAQRNERNQRVYTAEQIGEIRRDLKTDIPDLVVAHAIHVGSLKKKLSELCEKFDDNECVTVVFGKHPGWPVAFINVEGKTRMSGTVLEFDPKALLDPNYNAHWHTILNDSNRFVFRDEQE